jgi:DNA-binding response OmpR family regulator
LWYSLVVITTLLVGADRELRSTVERAKRSLRLRVFLADDTADARGFLATIRLDLLVIEGKLEGALAFVEELRRDRKADVRALPVLIVAASGSHTLSPRREPLGSTLFAEEPLEEEDLVRAVGVILPGAR